MHRHTKRHCLLTYIQQIQHRCYVRDNSDDDDETVQRLQRSSRDSSSPKPIRIATRRVWRRQPLSARPPTSPPAHIMSCQHHDTRQHCPVISHSRRESTATGPRMRMISEIPVAAAPNVARSGVPRGSGVPRISFGGHTFN